MTSINNQERSLTPSPIPPRMVSPFLSKILDSDYDDYLYDIKRMNSKTPPLLFVQYHGAYRPPNPTPSIMLFTISPPPLKN